MLSLGEKKKKKNVSWKDEDMLVNDKTINVNDLSADTL